MRTWQGAGGQRQRIETFVFAYRVLAELARPEQGTLK
jgi:hypothetical protein